MSHFEMSELTVLEPYEDESIIDQRRERFAQILKIAQHLAEATHTFVEADKGAGQGDKLTVMASALNGRRVVPGRHLGEITAWMAEVTKSDLSLLQREVAL